MVCKKINWWQASWQLATITFVWSADARVLFPANQILLSLLCKGISSSCWHGASSPPSSNNSSAWQLSLHINTYFYKVSEYSLETTPTRNSQNVTICLTTSWCGNSACQLSPWLQHKSLPQSMRQFWGGNPGLYLHTPGLIPLSISELSTTEVVFLRSL